MKALIYRRISTNDLKQDIERQLKPLQKFCEEKGFEIIGDFKDNITGSSKAAKRPGFKELLNFIDVYPQKQELNVVFDEISRLGRNKMDILYNCELFTKQGINVHFNNPKTTLLKDGIIDENADLVITLFAQMAQSERNLIKERTKSSVQRTVKKGNSLGGIELFGYKNENKKLVVDNNEAEIVKMVFSMYAKNISSTQIMHYLNNNNIPTKQNKKWYVSGIISMLKNETYIGKRKVKNVIHIDESLRIIEDELFFKVNEIRKGKQNFKVKSTNIINPFVGLFRCGCGSSVIVNTNSNRKPLYKCGYRQLKACGKFGVTNYKNLNNVMATFLSNEIFKINDNVEYKEKLESELNNVNIELSNVCSFIDKIDSKKEKILNLYLDEMINKTTYIYKNDEIEKEFETLQNRKEIAEVRIEKIKSELDNMKIDLVEFEKEMDIEKFKYYIQKIVSKITIQKDDEFVKLGEFKSYFRSYLQQAYKLNVELKNGVNKVIYVIPFCKFFFIRTDNVSKLIANIEVENGGDFLQFKKVGNSVYTIIKIQEVFD